MIPSEVEDRLARYFFHRYLPDEIMMEIENLLVPFYLEDELPPENDMVKLAISIIDNGLEE
ncbi:hypothetical protein [Alkalibacterium indicireducens]|uniref:Uncharacterized protein n=1 Tax=Alkalibacterium indicireducens TaxID=398758 RepID=A0ABN1AEP9_9LACT